MTEAQSGQLNGEPFVLSLSKHCPSFSPATEEGSPSTSSGRTGFNFTPAPRSAQQGFTLIELMVVIVIIGLLATIVIVNVMPAQDVAMRRKAEADIALFYQSIEMYRLDMYAYPTQAQGLQALVTLPPGAPYAERYRKGGYIRRLPNDPWGHPYQYSIPGTRAQFDIYSLGADGRRGGEGENADIGEWK
jgi:general secretion pathway protein G